MGQLVPIRAGWHSDPPAGTEPAILFPKWTLGGTGFQPVVSGILPETLREPVAPNPAAVHDTGASAKTPD